MVLSLSAAGAVMVLGILGVSGMALLIFWGIVPSRRPPKPTTPTNERGLLDDQRRTQERHPPD